MEPVNTHQIYQQRINDFQQAINKEKKLAAALSWARLISFLIIVAGGVLFFRKEGNAMWLLLAGVALIAFIYLLVRYQKSENKLQLLKTLLNLNEKELQQATTWKPAFEDGSEFINDQHDFSSDLDVFGPASIFQFVNRTGTLSGKNRLAAMFRNPMQEVTAINHTQEALKVLAPEVEFRQLLTANAMLAKEEESDRKEINLWLDMPFHFLHNKLMNVAIWLCPLLVLATLVFYILKGHYYPFIGVIIINWLLLGSIQKKVMAQYSLMSHKEQILEKFSILLHLIRTGSFGQSVLLRQQQETAREADVALHQLSRIGAAFDQRLNLLVGILLNSVMLYDLRCILRLERWKVRHKEGANRWFEVIEQLEVWNSFATFAFNHPQYTYPQPQEAVMALEATALGHPLIPTGESVKNDGTIGSQASFLIITGSNMSGKSTFLRSVGSNLLLAMCGAPVCAESFVFSPVRLMTSMRIKDSIASHTSYFQAELLRLQHIIQQLKTGERVFILLDEILKGTNSEDKLSGSRSLIERFLQYNCLGMIATHDLELGHLEDAYPARIKNYCFESTIQQDHLFFDYRIREGIARNKNATFLMKQMDII
ncbi:MutS-related protein [Chitinophaga sp. MM2321]|uniref:MutS-related protein n=1 Tax=Chitinophaga sp. MM2321 TaxID=3137178 RepID=UPI0032D59A08